MDENHQLHLSSPHKRPLKDDEGIITSIFTTHIQPLLSHGQLYQSFDINLGQKNPGILHGTVYDASSIFPGSKPKVFITFSNRKQISDKLCQRDYEADPTSFAQNDVLFYETKQSALRFREDWHSSTPIANQFVKNLCQFQIALNTYKTDQTIKILEADGSTLKF